MELFCTMTEGVVSELCNEKGFADVHAVMNCVARLSVALRPDDDPGVVSGGGKAGRGHLTRRWHWEDQGALCKLGARMSGELERRMKENEPV